MEIDNIDYIIMQLNATLGRAVYRQVIGTILPVSLS